MPDIARIYPNRGSGDGGELSGPGEIVRKGILVPVSHSLSAFFAVLAVRAALFFTLEKSARVAKFRLLCLVFTGDPFTALKNSLPRRPQKPKAKRAVSDLFRPDRLGGGTTEGTKW